jgi:phage terminase small subunit
MDYGLERIPLEDRPLTPMQLRFVEEYIADSTTIKAAAIRAGYSISTAQESGSRLMADPRVRLLLKNAQDTVCQKFGITAERVIQELWKIAGANPGDIVNVDTDGEATVDPSKLVGEVAITTVSGNGKKVKSVTAKTVKPADKIAALGHLTKLLSMVPKEEISVKYDLSFADMVAKSFDPSGGSAPPALPPPVE